MIDPMPELPYIKPFITLNGTSNADLGFWVSQTSSIPVMPKTIDNLLHIRGKWGRYDFQADVDIRQIKLKCVIQDVGSIRNVKTILSHLSAFLTHYDGTPNLLELKFIEEYPELYFKLRYSAEIGATRINQSRAVLNFDLTLTAHDPFEFGEHHILQEVAHDSDYALHDINIDVLGTLQSAPVITLRNIGTTTVRGIRMIVAQTQQD